jgi:crotonobetainyl-CoA:carnitine CoA-transferase CaiB-like acyl-CoA transferase
VFETAPSETGEKDHLILAVGNDSQFVKFCAVAGLDHLPLDPQYTTNQGRVRHRDVLVPILTAAMKTRRKADWLGALEAAKVPCGAINNLAEVFDDPHVQARGMVSSWEHPVGGLVNLVASPLKLSLTPVRHDLAPPLLGEHTEAVLHEILGYGPADVARLREQHII